MKPTHRETWNFNRSAIERSKKKETRRKKRKHFVISSEPFSNQRELNEIEDFDSKAVNFLIFDSTISSFIGQSDKRIREKKIHNIRRVVTDIPVFIFIGRFISPVIYFDYHSFVIKTDN